jgi:hypothetical protein
VWCAASATGDEREVAKNMAAADHALVMQGPLHFYNNTILSSALRISNKYGSMSALKHPTKEQRLRRRGFQSTIAHHCSEIFLEVRHQFHTSYLPSNCILTNQQTSI